MTDLTGPERATEQAMALERFFSDAQGERRVKLDVFLRVLELAAERDNRWYVERWYRDNVQTGKAACLDITGGQWP